MSFEWKTVKLSEVSKIVGGGTPSTTENSYWDGNIPWITPKDLSGHKDMYVSSGSRSITEIGLKNSSAKLLPRDTVLFTSRAPIGYIAIASQPVCTNQGFKNLVLNDGYDCRFFYYLLKHHTLDIEVRATGSTFKEISGASLGSFEVSIPAVSVQKKIADFLSMLDDRITLLKEINETLEAIAQALFKSWFVDFDPVRAKSEGKLSKGMDEATAALFPDTLEETELGMVPKGWQVQKFGHFIERLSVGKKFDQKSALVSGAVPILDQGKSGIIGFHNEVPSVKATLETPVVVFANHTCYMRLICFDFSAIQNVLPFIGKGVDTVWAFYATKDRIKFSEYKGHWPDFAIEKTVVPSEELTLLYRRSVDSAVRRMRLNEMQAETLANLRDILLPRLISGQLRIADAEAELKKVSA